MKTLSPLAVQILPMLTTPQTAHGIWSALASDATIAAVDTALDELTLCGSVGCDEHEGAVYYYRRDREAERATLATWDARRREAERVRAATCAAAMASFDAERDATDPMASIKGAVVA